MGNVIIVTYNRFRFTKHYCTIDSFDSDMGRPWTFLDLEVACIRHDTKEKNLRA